MPKLVNKTIFFNAVEKMFGNVEQINREQVLDVCKKYKLRYPNWLVNNPDYRSSRGVYSLKAAATNSKADNVQVKENNIPVSTPVIATPVPVIDVNSIPAMTLPGVTAAASVYDLIPEKVQGYVPFGHFSDIRQIIKSRKFYPTYITGLSGNGKTMAVEQICAIERRECVRVNVTIETDEDDLIGGFRLIDGHTVWQNGPVIVAMERGALLLLDEVDLGSNKLMCLQPILEGHSIYLKKINRLVKPAAGFNIIATANTKGKGSDDGRFIGTNIMNEAFLERFSVTFEQEYPPIKTETKILNNVLANSNVEDTDFVDKLVSWADIIRKTFYEGAINEIISTRRLVHIVQAYMIFGLDREKAIYLCLNRFDNETKNAFLDLYKKLDDKVSTMNEQENNVTTETVLIDTILPGDVAVA